MNSDSPSDAVSAPESTLAYQTALAKLEATLGHQALYQFQRICQIQNGEPNLVPDREIIRQILEGKIHEYEYTP
jgi:hypothetical protein